ncbi:MAG: DUF3619 family protein [Gallionella sp.]|jgi:hypothetical protein
MNKQPKHINHQQIAELLTSSTGQLDAHIVSSLREARALALQKQRVAEPVFSLSAAGHHVHIPHTTHQWVAVAILLAALVAGVTGYWQNSQIPQDDIDILTDELPIEVFVDQ